jgi:hypothetical protein
MIIPLLQGIKAEAIAAERPIKSLLGLLGQKGKVKLPAKRLGFLSNVSEFFVQPLLHLRRNHMKDILLPSP